ncbi:MAG: hypothetical protein EA351_07585 [Gemmatimonadales bacterium]|nr:MAG: hypothetical protein EA351_07585 [Gemmatimonadales bacterium]
MMSGKHRSGELPQIPEIAVDYELVRELGRGGTAVVYLARDRDLGRDVAIKLIRPTYVKDEDAVARLVREARTVGKLQHPNIVMLLGTRRLSDGGLALILQYVPGRSLKDRIRAEGPLPFEDAERILTDLAKALAYAHRSRIVHRDIKPENVYLDEGVGMARLADFGIARAWDSDSGLTLPGTAIGTPSYMSPEQVDGRDLDGRSDIYSLGLLGWEMLTGSQPWEGESLYSVIAKQKNEDLPSIRESRPDVPDRLVRAIEGATRKYPEDRWKNADAFLAALGAESGGESDPLPGDRPPQAAMPPIPTPWSERSPQPARSSGPLGPTTPPPLQPVGPPAGTSPWDEERPDDPMEEKAGGPGWLKVGAGIMGVAILMILGLAFVEPEGGARAFVDGLNPWSDRTTAFFDDSEFIRRPEDARPPAEGQSPAEATGEDTGFEAADLDALDLDAFDVDAAVGEDPGPSGALSILQGDGQTGPPGAALASPLILLLVDETGAGIGGAEVEYEVVAGGGTVDPSLDVTRPDGSSLARWTLGDSGEQRVEARAVGVEGVEAVFRATLREAVPTELEPVSGVSFEGQPGQPLSDPVELRLRDDQGQPMPGQSVEFVVESGGGSVNPASVNTGSDGVARAGWTLGSDAGTQILVARVADRSEVEVRFEARLQAFTLPVRSRVVAGGSHSCVLGGDGTALCWGANDSGQLGDGSGARRLAPSAPAQGGPFAELAAGVSHSCALTREGEAYCWGANDQGQLGRTGGGATTPSPVTSPEVFTRVAAGLGHSCALSREGTVYCWGQNGNGQLGDGTTTSRSRPARVAGDSRFTQITSGWRHSCALDGQGNAHCWGDGSSGQLGHGGTSGSSSPRAVGGGHQFTQLAGGNAHTCGRTANGRILCWGSNQFGQLGTGGSGNAPVPTPIESDDTFTRVTAGGVHTCGVAEGGAAFCWGRNLYGQIGDGTTSDRTVPTSVAGGIRFADLAALGSHNCGRTPGGEIYCWGYNVEGQLGDGTRQNRSEPVPSMGGGS